MTEAYPLAWPHHVARTPTANRKRAAFSRREFRPGQTWSHAVNLTLADGRTRLLDEIGRLKGARGIVLSSNVELRNDGLPRSGQRDPVDPGVAIYFHLGDKPYCLPCDRWGRVADNLAAVAGHISATRAIERYGVGTVEQAFSGFMALPSPTMERPWREVMELHRAGPVTMDAAEEAFRRLAKERHPDTNGGNSAMMAELNLARAAARRELAG